MKLFTVMMTAALLMFAGCSENMQPEPAAAKPLIVGMDADYPPLTFKDSKGTLQGAEVDFAYALGRELGRPVQIEVLPWPQLADAILNRGVDIVMSGVSVTKERAAKALFTKPYAQISQMAVMKEGAKLPDPFRKGRGMKVGFQSNTTSEAFVKRVFPEATMVPSVTMRDGMVKLLEGKTDYFFADAPAVWYYTANTPLKGLIGWYVPYTQENLAWAIAGDNIALKERVDAVIEKWKNNGFITETLQKWIPVRIVTPQGNKPIHFQ